MKPCTILPARLVSCCFYIADVIITFGLDRYDTNDTELLDKCAFMDPRTKSLAHLPVDQRNRVITHVTSILTPAESESTPTPAANPTPSEPEAGGSGDGKPGVLKSILARFSVDDQLVAGDDELVSGLRAKDEIRRYQQEPAIGVDGDPLLW